METRIEQWGNGVALPIPQPLAKQMGLTADTAVSLEIRDGRLSVGPVGEPRFTLEELLAGITEDNLHGEVATGPAVGCSPSMPTGSRQGKAV